jgi:hypothetical protein
MTTTKPLEINESRDFMAADGKTVAVTRVTATCYRVVTLDLRGHSIPCYTAEFDHLAGNVPVGISGRRAAWDYMQCLLADFGAAVETPAQVVARTVADHQFTAALTAKVSPAGLRAVARADAAGVVHRGHGVSETTLRSLARLHLGELVYRTRGLRKSVAGLRLNRDGLRLHATLTDVTLAA